MNILMMLNGITSFWIGVKHWNYNLHIFSHNCFDIPLKFLNSFGSEFFSVKKIKRIKIFKTIEMFLICKNEFFKIILIINFFKFYHLQKLKIPKKDYF